MNIEKVFFELIQVAIGTRDTLSVTPSKEQWIELFALAKKQALVAIAFAGVSKMVGSNGDFGTSIGIPEVLYLKWLGLTAKMQRRNREALEVCRGLYERYSADGFHACVMKGQANRRYYPEELAEARTCGDIDMWLWNDTKHSVRDVMEYFERKDDIVSLCYLHIENRPVDGVPLEVHFRPSFMNALWANGRFLKLFKEDAVEKDEALGFDVLKVERDVVFQMNHIYRHLLDEGVGLRQVVDYYFVLKTSYDNDDDNDNLLHQIERVGMRRFAGALMFVLKEVLVMPSEYLLCEPDEKEGRFLLDEIMRSGNFGHYDPRMQKMEGDSHSLRNQLHRVWLRARRNMRFVTSYPSEVIWEPVARVEHFLWRKLELWRY